MNYVQTPFQGIKSVLVVFSSKATAFDQSGFRNLITHVYPGAVVFFISTSGQAVGVEGPNKVDLVIDLTEPGARQSLFFARRMRSRGKYVVGRKVGWFVRRNRYDRVYDDRADRTKALDYIESERHAQKKVLELAGISIVRQGGVTPDLSREIASHSYQSQNRS